jgi:SAM-dependent methyltransferase
MSEDVQQDRYARFAAAYANGQRPPWDSGIVPPEVIALATGAQALPPGCALDLGCGTGVSAVYLAQHGWQVTGVDWIAEAITRAVERAASAGLSADQAAFLQADVTDGAFLRDHPPVDVWLDIGCLHGLPDAGQQIYAQHAARLVRPGGIMRLYAWRQHERDGRFIGLNPDQMAALFHPAFVVEDVVFGQDDASDVRPSAWYWLRRQV